VPKVRLVGEKVTAGVPACAAKLHNGTRLNATHRPALARK
jgi:hypothetical protein